MSAALAPVRLIEVLHVARMRNASDLHLVAGSPPIMRIDGALEVQSAPASDSDEIAGIARELLGRAALERFDEKGDVSLTYRDEEIGSVRVHAYRTSSGVCLAMRLLARSVPALEDLHLPPVVASFAERSAGLVIFAGPTGCGKSTALAAVVERINRTASKHIIAIEDPIEYQHRANRCIVSQREVGSDVRSFAEAVYGALRCDPDVILIGEMREPATMHAALTAAETGHLVLATLHTGDAPQTVDRIVGAFSGEMQEQIRIQLAQTLIGVVCMRLVRRACGRGRRPAAEILVGNDAVRNVIRDSKTHQLRNIMSTSRQSGMQTLETHLSDLLAHREIAFAAAKGVAERLSDLRLPEPNQA